MANQDNNIQKSLKAYIALLFLIFSLNNGFYAWYYHFYLFAANLIILLFLMFKEDGSYLGFNIRTFPHNIISLLLLILIFQLFLSPYTYRAFSVFIKVINFVIIFYITMMFLERDAFKLFFFIIITIGFLSSIYGIFDGYFHSFYQISGTFINKNIFAGLIILSVNLLYALVLWDRSRQVRILSVFFSLPVFIAAGLSLSKGALLTLFLSLILVSYFKNKKAALIISCLLTIIALLVIISFNNNFIGNSSIAGRVSIWKTTVIMISDNMLKGVGLGMYEEFIRTYDYSIIKSWDLRYAFYPNYAHNEYLQIFAEAGVFTFLPSLFFIICFIYRMIKDGKTVLPENKKYFYGFTGVFFSVLFQSFFDCGIEFYPITLSFTVSCAGILKYSKSLNEKIAINPLKEYKFVIFASSLIGILISVVIIISGYFYYLGNEYQDRDIDKSVIYLRLAVKLNPFNAAYHDLLADAYIKRTNLKKSDEFPYAVSELQKAVKLNRHKAQYYYKLASINMLAYEKKKEKIFFNDAVFYFKKSIELRPYGAQYFLRFGEFYFDNRIYTEALYYFKKASHIENNYAKSYYFQGLALTGLNRLNEAKEKLLEAISVNEKMVKKLEKDNNCSIEKVLLSDYQKEMVSLDIRAAYNTLSEIEKRIGNPAESKKWKELSDKMK